MEELGASGYHCGKKFVTLNISTVFKYYGIWSGKSVCCLRLMKELLITELGVSDLAETGTWEKYGGYLGLRSKCLKREIPGAYANFRLNSRRAGLRRLSALVGESYRVSGGR